MKERAASLALRRFKRYPAYKDSGVEWLGEIPAHWEQSKVKFLGKYVNGYPFKPEDWSVEGLPIIRIQNLTDPNASFNRFEGAVDPRYRVRRGDILISWSASLGLFVWTHDEDAWLNQHIFKVQLDYRAISRDFFVWLGDWFIRELQKEAHGSTMTHLTWGRFGSFRVEIPPAPEQRAIVAFLDRETARIDALVAKKERLCELLQEKRTALITRAVTKGLDPTAPMEDSGVEWLGEIPAHWEVKRLKWAAQMVSGHTPNKKVESYWQGGDIPWVSLADTSQLREVDYIATTAMMTTSDGIAHSSAHVLPEGTVVFSRDATIGLCAITGDRMAVSQHFIGWVCGLSLRPEYLLFVLRSITQELERLTMGATVRTIGMPDVKGLVTPIPPLDEQDQIVHEVLRGRARIDALIAKVHEAIALLKEFRTALISAAVTGKIDVREEVAA